MNPTRFVFFAQLYLVNIASLVRLIRDSAGKFEMCVDNAGFEFAPQNNELPH